MPRRLVAPSLALLALILLALLVASCRSGDPDEHATVTVGGDAREDAPFVVKVKGMVSHGVEAWAAVAPVGADCSRGSAVMTPVPVSGGFALDGTAEVERPGRYEACALVRRDGRVEVVGRRAVAVRAARGAVALAVPGVLEEFSYFDARISGQVEAAAELVLVRSRAAGACDLVAPRFGEQDVDEAKAVGPGRFAERFNAVTGDAGRVAWCAVLREGGPGSRVLAVARRTMLVPAA